MKVMTADFEKLGYVMTAFEQQAAHQGAPLTRTKSLHVGSQSSGPSMNFMEYEDS